VAGLDTAALNLLNYDREARTCEQEWISGEMLRVVGRLLRERASVLWEEHGLATELGEVWLARQLGLAMRGYVGQAVGEAYQGGVRWRILRVL